MLLHDSEELDDDLRVWSNQDLSLSGLLGIVDGLEAVVLQGNVRCYRQREKLGG